MSNDLSISDSYDDDLDIAPLEVTDESESVTKAGNAKASLMKRRLIDELLIQKKLERSLEDLNFDLDD